MLPASVGKDVHLRRTAREGPMEAFKHIVLALETELETFSFRAVAHDHVQIYAQVCAPYLGIRIMEIG